MLEFGDEIKPQAVGGSGNTSGTYSTTYPVILPYWSEQTLRDKTNGKEAVLGLVANPQNLEVCWDIKVETKALKNLKFNNLNITLFGSNKQGLENFRYTVSQDEPGKDNQDYEFIKNGDSLVNQSFAELMSANTSITKDNLGDYLYIRVKAPLKPGEYHSKYSIGLRINPDQNYVETLLNEFMAEYEKIPALLKYIIGYKQANQYASTPFNLVEDMFVAEFSGLGNTQIDENFYYDNTRTIVANNISNIQRRWYALDLLRIGETEDQNLRSVTLNPTAASPTVVYYVPNLDGGYTRRPSVSYALMNDSSYMPGTIVSYDYQPQVGTEFTNYQLNGSIKQKPKDMAQIVNNENNIYRQGGNISLYSRKLSYQDTNYLAYTEDPYPIMRINKTFEMVQCYNYGMHAPVVKPYNLQLGLIRKENPDGLDLYNNLSKIDYDFGYPNPIFANIEPGGIYNPNRLSKEAATEDLFKRIYFYADEVKREFEESHPGQSMHRLIENGMKQRVIHYVTNGSSVENNFQIPGVVVGSSVSWGHDWTLKGNTVDKNFKGDRFNDPIYKDRYNFGGDGDGTRKLLPGEQLDSGATDVPNEQAKYAKLLLDKINESYKRKDWEEYHKAESVSLVFYDHSYQNTQKLITGEVIEPVTIKKVGADGSPLKDAEFEIISESSGKTQTWSSSDSENGDKLYLKEGTYFIKETKAPEGYDIIDPFTIEVKYTEQYPDDGSFNNISDNFRVHVNDGYKIEKIIKSSPLDVNGQALVQDKGSYIEVRNISNNLGKINFTKRNASVKLNGSEFTLTKLDVKNDSDAQTVKDAFINRKFAKETVDSVERFVYQKTSDGITADGSFGEFEFKEMSEGYYLLEESKVPHGYEKAENLLLHAKKDGNNKVVVYLVTDEGEKDFPETITNKPKTTDISFRKIDGLNKDTNGADILLQNAKFRLISNETIDHVGYIKDAVSDSDGLVKFKGLSEGSYILEELIPPKGYLLPKDLPEGEKFYYWKLFVKVVGQGENEKFEYSLYKLFDEEQIDKSEEELDKIENSKITWSDIYKDGAANITNSGKSMDWKFSKYIENPDYPENSDEKFIPIGKDKLSYIKFNLYKADYYGNAVDGDDDSSNGITPLNNDDPIVADENGEFHLQDLKFNGYYRLKEIKNYDPKNPYQTASDIVLNVLERDGKNIVIARDLNTNTLIGPHGVFQGVINYNKATPLGQFAVKKTGMLAGTNVEVGLRRAFFRLYTANDDFSIKMNGDYPAEYIQKVTPGEPVYDKDNKPVDPGKLPLNQGVITFDQLKPGKYVLEEYRGPAGYEKDPDPWYVLVKEVEGQKEAQVIISRDKNDDAFSGGETVEPANIVLPKNTALKVNTEETSRKTQMLRSLPFMDIDPQDRTTVTNYYYNDYATLQVKTGPINTVDGSRDIEIKIRPKLNGLNFIVNLAENVITDSFEYSDVDDPKAKLYPQEDSRGDKKYLNLRWLQETHTYQVKYKAKLDINAEDEKYYYIHNDNLSYNTGNPLKIYNGLATYNYDYSVSNSLIVSDFTTRYDNNPVYDSKLIKGISEELLNLKVKFSYNYYDYKDEKPNLPNITSVGKFWLQYKKDGNWQDVPDQEKNLAPFTEAKEFDIEGLDKSLSYRIVYKLDPANADLFKKIWEWESDTKYYPVDFNNVDSEGNVIVEISNGNLLKIFNHDEDGFRIPLRIAKADEDELALPGSSFRARKLVDGEPIKDEDGNTVLPKYYDEGFDAVTEATGLEGDNYFRELTPGIYELTEAVAPDGYKKLEDKWYFKVKINPNQTDPGGADYMIIDFDFAYSFPSDLSGKEYNHMTSQEKARLKGKTIYGLAYNTNKDKDTSPDLYKDFIKNVEIIEDHGLSNPARPDAPYQGINVVQVTNHKSDSTLKFLKVDKNNKAIKDAIFTLTQVEVDDLGKVIIDKNTSKPKIKLNESGDALYQRSSTSNGALGVNFEGLTQGTYILEEKAPEGYEKVNTYLVIRFTENEDGKLVQSVDKDQSDPDFYKLVNFNKDTGEIQSIKNINFETDLIFYKKNIDGFDVNSSGFKVVEVDDSGSVIPNGYMTEIPINYSNKFVFTGLKEGRYRLTEIKTPTDYQEPNPWYFRVKEVEGKLLIEFETTPISTVKRFIDNYGSSDNEGILELLSSFGKYISDNKIQINDNVLESISSQIYSTNPILDYSVEDNSDGSFNIVNYPRTDFSFNKVGTGFMEDEIPLPNIYFSLKKVLTEDNSNGMRISYYEPEEENTDNEDGRGKVLSIKDQAEKELLKYDESGTLTNPKILDYAYYDWQGSQTNGQVDFKNLSQGVYELKEVKLNDRYNENTQRRWIIKVVKGEKGLKVIHDKAYETEYFKKYEEVYYNNIYLKNGFENSKVFSGETGNFKITNIRDTVDIKWRKIGRQEFKDQKIEGIITEKNPEFKLYRLDDNPKDDPTNSNYLEEIVNKSPTEEIDQEIISANGYFGYYNLEEGVYLLEETKAPQGFKEANRDIIVQVIQKGELPEGEQNINNSNKELVIRYYELKTNEDGSKTLVTDPKDFNYIKTAENNGKFEVLIDKDGYFDFINISEENLGSFQINKKDSKGEALSGAKFELKDKDGNVVDEKTSDSQGKVIFLGLEPGVYFLRESLPPQGYQRSELIWRVTVLSNGHTFVDPLKTEGENKETVSKSGNDVSSLIVLDTNPDNSNISFEDKSNDNKIIMGTDDNNIEVNLSMKVNGQVNEGDYFVIHESDSLHYNMLQPDKLAYPPIEDKASGEILAVPKIKSSFNIEKGTNKEIYYVFTDKVNNKSDINMSVTLPSSVNMNICKVYGDYEFSVSIGNQELRRNISIEYPERSYSNDDKLNIDSAYMYTNDELGVYTQLVYINPDGSPISGDAKLSIYPAASGTPFNMANISEKTTRFSLYKLKEGAYLPQAVIFEEENWEPVPIEKNQIEFKTFTERDDVDGAEITFNNEIGNDKYLLVVDSEMKMPTENQVDSEGKIIPPVLSQFAELQAMGTNVVKGVGIQTNAGAGSGSGNEEYTPTELSVINNPLVEKGKFTITKKDDSDNFLPGASFKLTKIKDENGKDLTPVQIIGTKESDLEGKISFDELEAGSYKLEEIEAPDGYEKTDETWIITVDANGITKIEGDTLGTNTENTTNPIMRFFSRISPMRLFASNNNSINFVRDFSKEKDTDVYENSFLTGVTKDNATVTTSAQYDSDKNQYKISLDILAGENLQGVAKKKDIVVILPLDGSNKNQGAENYKKAIETWISPYKDNDYINVSLVTYVDDASTSQVGLTNVNDFLIKLNSTDFISGTKNGTTGIVSAFNVAKNNFVYSRADADKIIIHASSSQMTNTNLLRDAIKGINKGNTGNTLSVYQFNTGTYYKNLTNYSTAFNGAGNIDEINNYGFFAEENPPYSGKFIHKSSEEYIANLPSLTSDMPAVNDAELSLSFNEKFDFVRKSTNSDKPGSDQWHSGYDENENLIKLKENELSLEAGQTAHIDFKVTPKRGVVFDKDTPIPLIKVIKFKPRNGTEIQEIAAPQATFYDKRNITIKSGHDGDIPKEESTITADLVRTAQGRTENVASVSLDLNGSIDTPAPLRVKNDNYIVYDYKLINISSTNPKVSLDTDQVDIGDISKNSQVEIKSTYDANIRTITIKNVHDGVNKGSIELNLICDQNPNNSKTFTINTGEETQISVPKNDENENLYSYRLEINTDKLAKDIAHEATLTIGDTFTVYTRDFKGFSAGVNRNGLNPFGSIKVNIKNNLSNEDMVPITLNKENYYYYELKQEGVEITSIEGSNEEEYDYNFSGSDGKYIISVRKKTNPNNVPDIKVINKKIYKGHFQIKKTNEDGTKALSGAVFTLTPIDENGNTIEGRNPILATSDGSGLAKFENIPTGTYKLKETKSPSGYLLSENEYTVTVSENGGVVSVTVKEPDRIELVRKQDITNSDSVTFHKSVRGGNGYYNTDVVQLWNEVIETDAFGYYYFRIHFEPLYRYNYNYYGIYEDNNGTLKLDFDLDNFNVWYQGRRLSGPYEITRNSKFNTGHRDYGFYIEAKNPTGDWNLSPLKGFSWDEISVGEDEYYSYIHLVNKQVKIDGDEKTLDKNNDFEYSLTNQKRLVKTEFTKVDKQDKTAPLEGAVFGLYKKDDKGVYIDQNSISTTDKNGKLKFDNLDIGDYGLKEITPPPGYTPLPGITKEFRIDGDGNTLIKNANGYYVERTEELQKIFNEKPGEFDYTFTKKDSKNMNTPLAGVVFDLYNEEGYVVQKDVVSNEKGEVTFENLNPGKYWIVEKKQLDGYILDPTPIPIIISKEWGVTVKPGYEVKDVSSYFTLDSLNESKMVSSTKNEDVVYPNTTEGLLTKLNYLISPDADIKPGDYFYLELNDSVDFDGIGYEVNESYDIYGSVGRIAKAEIEGEWGSRRKIKFTFTDAVDQYNTVSNLTINTPMFVNRKKYPFNTDREKDNPDRPYVDVKITVGSAVFEDKIAVDYDNAEGNGYIKSPYNVKTYQTRLDPRDGTFTSLIYVNTWRSKDWYKNIYFNSETPYYIESVKTYKRSVPMEYDKTTGEPNNELPWSFGLDLNNNDDLTKYGLEYVTDYYKLVRSPYQSGNSIYVDLDTGYWYPENNFNTDEYVIEIKGQLINNGDFKTTTTYERNSYYYNGKEHYDNWGRPVYASAADQWETWVKYYSPSSATEGNHDVFNVKNKIIYTKVKGGIEAEVPPQGEGSEETPPNQENDPNPASDINDRILPGAEFILKKYRDNLDGTSEYKEVERSKRISNENGLFGWEGLAPGKYQVWETKAPSGYITPRFAVSRFEVNESGNIVNIENSTLTIINNKIELPEAFSKSIQIFTIIRFLAMVIAVIVANRKKVVE